MIIGGFNLFQYIIYFSATLLAVCIGCKVNSCKTAHFSDDGEKEMEFGGFDSEDGMVNTMVLILWIYLNRFLYM